ncbi:TetR family transcriptional regulator [Saccharopolyspora gloriosae]|uniref:AcrR family transcriptional regulator n=1 Tax=Saccharopolyspora gloriosae TaxID=455344 RepID=A0A840NBA4_9PSEU|nr:TetR family transcriptional regulator [Saccharopolyspora gloriosae]MBB5069556.1 AcrR family transcriptional regulator [Saccharopolyspora gloriosae]
MPEQPRPRAGRTPQGRRRIRGTVSLAALDLFAANGFEATTVDQIAEAAGVGRRTFFRYFRSKEDAVFGDHEERLADVAEFLEGATGAEEPLLVVSRAAEEVLDTYLAEPEVSLQRFALTRQVSSLRDKEIASTDGYQRAFARYLRGRYAHEQDGALRAAVAAAAIVAAHNQVLREWLKSGAELDARTRLRGALAVVRTGLASAWEGAGEDVVVGVVRTGAPAAAVLKQLEEALRGLPEAGR